MKRALKKVLLPTKYETMTLEEFNRRNNIEPSQDVVYSSKDTVTVYSLDTIPMQKYCRDHSGVTVDKYGVASYVEECDCV